MVRINIWDYSALINSNTWLVSNKEVIQSTLYFHRGTKRVRIFVVPGIEQILRFNQSVQFNGRCFSNVNRFATPFVQSTDYAIKILIQDFHYHICWADFLKAPSGIQPVGLFRLVNKH